MDHVGGRREVEPDAPGLEGDDEDLRGGVGLEEGEKGGGKEGESAEAQSGPARAGFQEWDERRRGERQR